MAVRTPVEALRKGLEILELLSRAPTGVSLGEVSERMGLKRTTTHNLLKTLCLCGYGENIGDGCYRLGSRVGDLVRGAVSSGVPGPRVLQVIAGVSAALDEAVVLTGFVGGRRRVLARARGSQVIQVDAAAVEERGRRHWETVTGRVLAAFCAPAELAAIIAAEGYPGPCWEGIVAADCLAAALARIRVDRAAAAQDGEIVSYAVPVAAETGLLLGAVGAHLPAFRCDRARGTAIVSALRASAAELTRVWTEQVERIGEQQ